MSNVLIVGDTHLPFAHRHYLAFCKRIQKEFKCNKVVHIGDLVDSHSISFHDHDSDGLSPADEMKLVDKMLKDWFKAFPKLKLCLGNHDRLVDRKAKHVGLPSRVFKPFRENWNLPKGWEDDFEHEIDGVLYMHGTGYSGKIPHLNAAVNNRQNTVIGHCHSIAGYEWTASSKDAIFGMSVGCGIDKKSYAFGYGRHFPKKQILACGVIKNGEYPLVIKMRL